MAFSMWYWLHHKSLKLFNEFLHSDDPNVKLTPEDDEDQNDDPQDNQVDDAQDNQDVELDEEQEPTFK